MYYNQILFTNILRLLSELGMTKTELSERAQVSISFLSDLTTGKANPSLRVMEAIANALEMPLPVLLEFSDLDKETLAALAGGTAPQSLPPGYQRVSAVLTDFQAFRATQWDAENRARVYPKTLKRIDLKKQGCSSTRRQ